MVCVLATLFSTAVWFLIARLILSAFWQTDKLNWPDVLGYQHYGCCNDNSRCGGIGCCGN